MSIDKVIFKLADKFPKIGWDLEQTTIGDKFMIVVDDYDFYHNLVALRSEKIA